MYCSSQTNKLATVYRPSEVGNCLLLFLIEVNERFQENNHCETVPPIRTLRGAKLFRIGNHPLQSFLSLIPQPRLSQHRQPVFARPNLWLHSAASKLISRIKMIEAFLPFLRSSITYYLPPLFQPSTHSLDSITLEQYHVISNQLHRCLLFFPYIYNKLESR